MCHIIAPIGSDEGVFLGRYCNLFFLLYAIPLSKCTIRKRKKGVEGAMRPYASYIHFRGGIKYIAIKDDEIRQDISFSAI